MTLELWLILVLTLLAGAMSPGPSVALVIRTAVKFGRSSALATAFAHGAGIALYAVAVVLGLAVLIQSSTFLMTLLQISGALFLLFLGFRMFTQGVTSLREGDAESVSETATSDGPTMTQWQHALNGFLIVFLNPKVVIFFVAIFSQFLTADQSLLTQLTAAGLAGIIDAAWYALVAVFVSNVRFARVLNRATPLIDSVFGLLFMGFAVFLSLNFF